MFKIIQFIIDNLKKIYLAVLVASLVLGVWCYKIHRDNCKAIEFANDRSSGIPEKMFKSDNDISDYKQKIILMETAVMLNHFKVANND